MRTIVPLLLAGLAGPSLATSPMSPAFGNTVVSTYPDGRKSETWIEPGGGYTAEGRRHDRSDGHWSLRGAKKVCFKQQHPFPVPFSFCMAMPAQGVDTPFQAKAVTGETITISLVRGHVTPR